VLPRAALDLLNLVLDRELQMKYLLMSRYHCAGPCSALLLVLAQTAQALRYVFYCPEANFAAASFAARIAHRSGGAT